MTPQQQSDKINAFIAGFDDLVNDTFTKAIYNLETDIKERIFEEHLDVNGTKLGQYSTTPTGKTQKTKKTERLKKHT